MINLSLQLAKTSEGAASFFNYLRVSGNDVTSSYRLTKINGVDDDKIFANSIPISLSKGDSVEAFFSVSDISVQVKSNFGLTSAVMSIQQL